MPNDQPDWLQPQESTQQQLGFAFGIPVNGTQDLPTFAWQSLFITVNSGAVAPYVVQADFYPSPTLSDTASGPVTEFLSSNDAVISGKWNLPVIGGWVRLTNLSAVPLNWVVYGSNRVLTESVQMQSTYLPRNLGFSTTAFTVNVGVLFPVRDGLSPATTFNRDVWYSFAPGALGGQLYQQYRNPANASSSIQVVNVAANSSAQGTVPHPLGPTNWLYLPGATGNGAPSLLVQQAVVT